jgi:LuxR family transcriptional regulator, maltose regulon positive regulatory protein
VELAQTCWDGKETQTALEFLNESQVIFERYKANFDLAYTHYLAALWKKQLDDPQAETAWVKAVELISRGGYAFILEKEQENAFPLVATYLRGRDPRTRTATEQILEHLTQVPPPTLRIVTLGQFAVWKGRSLIPDRLWQKRKAGELFRYLLLQPDRSAGKEAILEALWPERSPDSGNDLLHQSTSTLRRILEPDLPEKFRSRYLSFEGEQITLLLPPGSMIDLEVFRQNLPAALQNNSPELLQEALNLYTGELFPADRYSEWCMNQREYLSELYQKGLLALARHHFLNLQFADALDCCRQISNLDPWNEEAVMLAMQCYRDLGTSPHAMRLYFRLETVLREDLGLAPNPEIRQLAESIRSR